VQFFRTIGGAVGIGLLGMFFNFLIAPEMAKLREVGVNPASLMDPHSREALSPQVLSDASRMIDHGLTWVFGAMLLAAVAQTVVTLLMPSRKPDHGVSRGEAMEAMAG